MKFGFRTPSLKKSLSARTTGSFKRSLKKKIIPGYGKKGVGWLRNPKKAAYNKAYNKTTRGCLFPVLIFLFFMVFSIVSLSQSAENYKLELNKLNQEYEKNEDYTTVGMLEAAEKYYIELDELLNRCYKELSSQLDEKDKKALLNSQREWIKYRDKEIEFAQLFYSKKEGTMWLLFPVGEKIDLVKNRINDLINYLLAKEE